VLVCVAGLLFPSAAAYGQFRDTTADSPEERDAQRPPYERGDARWRVVSVAPLIGFVEGGALAAVAVGETDDVDETGTIVYASLAGATLGGIVGLVATENRYVSRDAATLTQYGSLQGYAHAAQLIYLIGGADGVPVRAGAAMVAGLGGGETLLGYRLGQRNRWSAGTAEMVTFLGSAGNLLGLGTAVAVADGPLRDNDDARSRWYAGASLAGSLTGMYLGYRLGETGRYSSGDARIIATGGLIGASVTSSLRAVHASDRDVSDMRSAALAVAGAATGLGIGTLIGRTRTFTPIEGNIIAGTSLGVGWLGGAVASAIRGNTEGEGIGVAISTGAVLGYAGSILYFQRRARQRAIDQRTASVQMTIRPYVPPAYLAADERTIRPMLSLRIGF
jgi:hypothetical protein